MSQPLNEEYLVGLFKKGLVSQMEDFKGAMGCAVFDGDADWAAGLAVNIQKTEEMLRDEKALLKFAKEVMAIK